MMENNSILNSVSCDLISPLVITKLDDENIIKPIYDVTILKKISDYLVNQKKYRDNLLFVLACNSPISINQLRLLKVSDFFTSDEKLKDIIKFEGEEFILSTQIKEALYLHLNNSKKRTQEEYLFTSESGNSKGNQPIAIPVVSELLKKLSNEFGFSITLYTLKRTYLYHAQNNKCLENDTDSEPIKKYCDIERISNYLIEHKRYRDNMMFTIGINTGMRITKLRMLKFCEFINDDGTAKEKYDIIVKDTNDPQKEVCAYIPINESIKSAISLYRSNTPERQLGEYMFVSESGNGYRQDVPVSRQAVANFIERIFQEVGLEIKASADVFRKTFAFQQLVKSNNSPKVLYFLQQMLKCPIEDQVYSYVCSTPKEIESTELASATTDNNIIVSNNCEDLQQPLLILEEQESTLEQEIQEPEIDFSQYKQILAKDYRKGFRLNDKLSIKRLRMQWHHAYGEELCYDDETICKHISRITIRHGDMAYLPEVMLDEDTKGKLLSYINATFADGKQAIYYEALYKEFADDFASCRINNVEMLKTYLSYINDGSMYLNRSYIAADRNVEIDPTDEVRCFMISQGTAVLVNDVISSLSHLTEEKIRYAISGPNSQEFVWNQKGEYFHADIIEFTQHELDLITEWINCSIADKDYMGGKELTDAIQQKLPSIKERYPFLTEVGLRDVIAYKLQKSYSFKGKIISAYGKDLSMAEVFADFAKSHDRFTMAQLNSMKNDLETPIYFDAIYANSLRISKEEFVSLEQANFDVSATDSAIDRFCYGDFIPVKDVSLFGSFPDASFPWNHFLLQHYVANYSKKYKLIHAGYTAGHPVGAIVKRGAQIDTFDEVIIRALAKSDTPLNSDDALQYLCDVGFLARRKYGNIDTILVKANQQRAKKGE